LEYNIIYSNIRPFFEYFMEYNTAQSIPIPFLAEYGIPCNNVFLMISVIPRKSVFQMPNFEEHRAPKRGYDTSD
jgi:hypothetical protein